MVRVSSSQRRPHRDLLTAGSSEEWDHFRAGRDRYFTELRCPPSRVWQPQMHHVMISVQDGGDNAPEECDRPRSSLSCWVKVRVEPRLEPGRWTGDTNWARHRITTTLPPFSPETCWLIFNKPDLLPPPYSLRMGLFYFFFSRKPIDFRQGCSRCLKIIGFTHLHQVLMKTSGGKRAGEVKKRTGAREKEVKMEKRRKWARKLVLVVIENIWRIFREIIIWK